MITALALSAAMLNPAVTPATLEWTICRPGFAAAVRPPGSYTQRWERKHLRPGQVARAYVVDHIVPLELGGRPYAPNLQLQTKAQAKRKDRLENQLHRAVCAGRVRLEDAQARMEAWRP
jgi:hypothetical protein